MSQDPTLFAAVVIIAAFVVFLALGGGRVVLIWLRDPVAPGLPALAWLIVFAAPQMADMLAGMKSSFGGPAANTWAAIELAIGVFLLGLQGWFWSRAALNARDGYRDIDAPLNLPWQDRWAPRLTLVPTTLIAVSPVVLALQHKMPWTSVSWPAVIAAVVLSIVLWVAAAARRRRHVRRRQQQIRLAGALPAARPLPAARICRLFAAAPLHATAPWLLLGLATVLFAVIQSSPDVVNDWLNTPSASLIALSSLVPIASIVLALLRDGVEWLLIGVRWLADRLSGAVGAGFPAVGSPLGGVADILGFIVLIALSVGGSYAFEALGSYDVIPRSVRDANPPWQDPRPNLAQALTDYAGCHAGEAGPIPAIIVASEGGASRSALWTLSMMRFLDAKSGGAFGTHLFAISSVSGGSLAAVTYGLAQAKQFGSPTKAPSPAEQENFWQKAAVPGVVELGRADLLSSAIADLFTSDMLVGAGARASTLAGAFAHFWASSKFQLADQVSQGFVGMRGVTHPETEHNCSPHLILNGTDVDTGDRLLTSTIAFGALSDGNADGQEGQIRHPFAEAVDVIHQQNADISPGEAVLDSARFPIISPPGLLPQCTATGADKACAPPPDNVRTKDFEVIDGGVYDNDSGHTVWELATAINLANTMQTVSPELDPIIVLITNDFDDQPLICADHAVTAAATVPTPTPARPLQPGQSPGGVLSPPEALSSPLGLYSVRGAHARTELAMLYRQYCSPNSTSVFHFDLAKPHVSEDQSAPMNWVLDETSCHFMLGDARQKSHIPEQADALVARLRDDKAAVGPDDSADADKDADRCLQ